MIPNCICRDFWFRPPSTPTAEVIRIRYCYSVVRSFFRASSSNNFVVDYSIDSSSLLLLRKWNLNLQAMLLASDPTASKNTGSQPTSVDKNPRTRWAVNEEGDF